jgi:hypothetical protein
MTRRARGRSPRRGGTRAPRQRRSVARELPLGAVGAIGGHLAQVREEEAPELARLRLAGALDAADGGGGLGSLPLHALRARAFHALVALSGEARGLVDRRRREEQVDVGPDPAVAQLAGAHTLWADSGPEREPHARPPVHRRVRKISDIRSKTRLSSTWWIDCSCPSKRKAT